MNPLSNRIRALFSTSSISWAILTLIVCALGFYNLGNSPLPWHDEGAALSLAKTLATEGVYASRNLNEYQTFGPVQSVGPTVILPVALNFKLFGVSLLNGRIIAAIFFVLTILVFLGLFRKLFDYPTAWLAVALLLSSPAAKMLFHGRQVVGEVPALGFLVAGCLLAEKGIETRRNHLLIASGSAFGLSILTKNTYAIFVLGALFLIASYDLFFHRRARLRALVIIGVTALLWFAGWQLWQYAYFGIETMRENAQKFATLANAATGFDLSTSLLSFKFLFDSSSGFFYMFWGLPACLYFVIWAHVHYRQNFSPLFLWVFAMLWLGYYLFWSKPWLSYVFVPSALTAVFVSKLWLDAFKRLRDSQPIDLEIKIGHFPRIDVLVALVLATASLTILYPLQNLIQENVLSKSSVLQELKNEINNKIPETAIIETWERELDILTNRRYHYPDQAMLASVHRHIYRGGPLDYALGEDYFKNNSIDYLIIGWFGRWTSIYDMQYVTTHSEMIAVIGEGEVRYEVFKLSTKP